MNSKNNYLVLSIVIIIFGSVDGRGKLYTAYSCEGHTLKLSCYFGDRIKVIKADYGRWNATLCQYFEDSEMNLNCHSAYAQDIIKSKCNGYRSCKIKADNEHMLEDPCPGQVKYAEAKYMCIKKPNDFKDELISKGFNGLLNMANDYSTKNNKIEYGNNINSHKYEVQSAYNPSFKKQFNEHNSQPGSIGWNVFK